MVRSQRRVRRDCSATLATIYSFLFVIFRQEKKRLPVTRSSRDIVWHFLFNCFAKRRRCKIIARLPRHDVTSWSKDKRNTIVNLKSRLASVKLVYLISTGRKLWCIECMQNDEITSFKYLLPVETRNSCLNEESSVISNTNICRKRIIFLTYHLHA